MPETLLRLNQVMARTGLSRSSIYQRIKSQQFPAQSPIGARAVAWSESSIEAWIQSRLAINREKRA